MIDANGMQLATVRYRNDVRKFSWTHGYLTADEARRIAKAITRLPEFLMQRRGFYSRGEGQHRWKPSRPYHVALESDYIRAHWDEIDTICKLNGLPFNATGEKIQDRGIWSVYEFQFQLDAIQFWDAFNGRWLRGSEFHYPERPKDLPPLKLIKDWQKFDPRKAQR
ncbi:MAG: hypothetical protein NVV83_01585 [Afipia sp.]|nr:hypothetical protein [Afipia sp.]